MLCTKAVFGFILIIIKVSLLLRIEMYRNMHSLICTLYINFVGSSICVLLCGSCMMHAVRLLER